MLTRPYYYCPYTAAVWTEASKLQQRWIELGKSWSHLCGHCIRQALDYVPQAYNNEGFLQSEVIVWGTEGNRSLGLRDACYL